MTSAGAVADDRGRRADAATGVVAAVLFLVGFGLPGTPPSPNDTLDTIASYLTGHRTAILVGDFVIGLGVAFYIWFLGSLRSYLRAGEGGEGRLSAAAFLGGGVAAALILAGAGAQAGLVLHIGTISHGDILRVSFDTYNAFITIAGAALAVAVAGVSCSAARSGALPPAVYWSGSVIAGLQITSCAALFATSGFFAAGGPMTLVAFVAVSIWYIWVAVLIMRRRGVPPVVRTEP